MYYESPVPIKYMRYTDKQTAETTREKKKPMLSYATHYQ